MELTNELCQCDEYKKIAGHFIPYYFNTINPYRKPMTRWDGTPCECDEYSLNQLYKKEFRWADKSCFDTETTVRLPPYQIEWRIRPIDSAENRLVWPKAIPLNKSVSQGIIQQDRKSEKAFKHELHLQFYQPPKPEHLKMTYY